MVERPQGEPWGRSFLSRVVLSFLLFAGAAPAPTLAADAVSEIPGVTWVGPSVSSTVGGDITDRVWRIQVTSARQAVIDLTGASGAELGLYVFGSTATSILTATPLRQSAKAGGAQSLSVPMLPGTYYLNVNGRNIDRAYAFTLRVALVADPTPPFVTIDIANGAQRISDQNSTLRVAASDSLSGIDAIRTRLDGGAWGEWLTPAVTIPISFPEIEGLHSYGLQARNGAGLITTASEDRIYLDLTTPTAQLVSPAAGATVSTATPKISVRFNEAMDAAAWRSGGLIVESPDGSQLAGTGAYDATTKTGTFVSGALVPGTGYVVRLGTAKDVAGNLAELEPWTITYVATTKITTSATALTVPNGSTATLLVSTTGIEAGAELRLERLTSLGGGEFYWEEITRIVATGSTQAQRLSFTPDQSATYSIRYDGSEGALPSRSASIRVGLLPVVRYGAGTVARSTVKVGASVPLSFSVAPLSITSATLIGSKCSSTFTKCTVAVRIPLSLSDDGLATYAWTAKKGYWSWRLAVPASPLNLAVNGPVARITVR